MLLSTPRALALGRHLLGSLCLAGFLAIAVLAVAPAAADHPAGTGGQRGPDPETRGLTQQLVRLSERLADASDARRPGLTAQIEELVETRRARLAALIEDNPAEALKVALPGNLAAALPGSVRDLLETRAEIEGVLTILHVHGEAPDESEFLYFLETAPGERYSLHFVDAPPPGVSGQAIRAQGLLLAGDAVAGRIGGAAGAMAVIETEDDPLVLQCCDAGSGDPVGAASGPALANTLGEQRTAVILVNFADDPSEPFTAASVAQRLDGTTNDFFLENSYGLAWLSNDYFGWYTLALTAAECQPGTVGNAADQAAADAGVDLTAYQRIVYVLNGNAACAFSGLGTVGGAPSRSWVNGLKNWTTFAHELGHNLGLFHSHALDCGAAVIGDGCGMIEYGDTADLMGGWNSHFNAYQKDRLGWLGSNGSPPLTTVESSGQYQIAPYAEPGDAAKALKVLRATDPASGEQSWYYFEQRVGFGFDSSLGDQIFYNFFDGVLIHSGSSSNGNSSALLDLNPDTSSWFDPALEPGFSFDDSQAGVTVTTDWVDDGGATVTVALGVPECVPAGPSVLLDPPGGHWRAAGTTLDLTVTVTSHDSTACSAAVIDLAVQGPAGWAITLGGSVLVLSPGETASTTLQVTSPGNAAIDYYDITALATHATDPAATGADSVVYVVTSNDSGNLAPSAANDNASTDYETPVIIAVLANDSDPDGDPLTVTTLNGGANGAIGLNGDGTVTYTPNPGFSGNDSFGYTVSDGKGGSNGATVAVAVAPAPNRPPLAQADSVTTDQDLIVTIAVLANDSDPDGDTLSLAAVGPSANGATQANGDGSVTYSPDAGFSGTDSFTYTVGDGRGGTATAVVTVTVNAVDDNSAPNALDDSASTTDGVSVAIVVLANDSDPDGDPLTVAAVTQGGKGSVAIDGQGRVIYTPGPKFRGSDTFSYTVSDGATTAQAFVTVAKARGSGGDSGGNGGSGKGNGKPGK